MTSEAAEAVFLTTEWTTLKKRFKFFLNLPELKELLMFYQMNQIRLLKKA